jgi:hypothetical protein
MTKRRKQAIILLTLSVPMMWWGLSNIISETPSSNILSIMISVSTTFGGLFAISGLVMLVTKNSLGIWNLDDKGRGESLLVSQTTVKDSPIQKEIINKKQKVNEMAETTNTSVEMMKREKELEARRKELEGLLEEVRHEETKLEQSLQEKGWVKKDGEWGIG